MSRTQAAIQGARKHLHSDRRKALAASALSQKVGYLRVEDLPGTAFFNTLASKSFNPHRIIRATNELFLVVHGLVEIWHTRYDKLVKSLEQGTLFGEMPLLGQSMLGTKAMAGAPGATVNVINEESALEWVKSAPSEIMQVIGSRLTKIEAAHYRSQFQLADSRIAALLLELAGEDTAIIGLSHEEIGERIGFYRETITNILNAMKMEKLIEVGRKRVTVLDKRALRELSEL
jgi:CRP/FNR family transcriptional regulator, cyclic AMP receptor protein